MKRFIKAYIKDTKKTWSLFPSSAKLINSMLKHVDFSEDLNIVEYWPWLWHFTKSILSRASKKSKITIFEVNDEFIKELQKIEDPRLKIIHGWAENINSYMKDGEVDAIVSWLPFGSLGKTFCLKVLNASYKVLKKDWIYLQFQYFLSNLSDVKWVFWNHELFFEPINFPPAFIYKCYKKDLDINK